MDNNTDFTQEIAHGFEVVGFYTLYETEATFAALRFDMPNFGTNETRIIPIADVRTSKLKSHFPDKFALPNKTLSETVDSIRKEVNNKLCTASKSEIKTLIPQGFCKVNDKWLYAIGDLIINDSDNEFMAFNPSKIEFLPPKGKIKDSIVWIETYCLQKVAALFLCSLTPYLKPVTQELGLPQGVVNAYIVGRSGCGKTSFAELLTSAFGLRGINLGSKKSQIAAEQSKYIDKPMLADDWNNTSSSREYSQKLFLLSELLQMTSCAGNIISDEGSMDFSRTALIVTAEEHMSNPSSMNRTVVIKLNTPFNAQKLTYLQNNRHLYTHFLRRFIEWLCKNASAQVQEIRKRMVGGSFNMNVEHGDSENYIGFARISNSHLLMKIAQHLLIAFLRSQSIGASYNELNAYLDAAIKTAIKDTLNSVKVEDSYSPITDAVIGIFRRDNDNIVAEDYDEYRKDDSMMFFRYKGEYFFKAEGLAAHLCKKLGKKYSSKQILSELDEFLTFNNEGVTRHLPHQLRKKKPENNQRFSALSKEALIDYIVSTSSSYFDYSGSPIKKLRKNEF